MGSMTYSSPFIPIDRFKTFVLNYKYSFFTDWNKTMFSKCFVLVVIRTIELISLLIILIWTGSVTHHTKKNIYIPYIVFLMLGKCLMFVHMGVDFGHESHTGNKSDKAHFQYFVSHILFFLDLWQDPTSTHLPLHLTT